MRTWGVYVDPEEVYGFVEEEGVELRIGEPVPGLTPEEGYEGGYHTAAVFSDETAMVFDFIYGINQEFARRVLNDIVGKTFRATRKANS